jgi:3D (Asp-Asp-Asp) domain-containing protein
MSTRIGRKTLIFAVVILAVLAGVEVYYYFSHRAIIFADGKRIVVITKTKNSPVRDVLDKAGVKYDIGKDLIEPPLEDILVYPRIIRVWRITEDIEVSTAAPRVVVAQKIKSYSNLRPVIYKKIKIVSETTRTRVVRKDGVETLREVVEKSNSVRYEEYLHLLDAKGKKAVVTYRLNDCPKKKMVATAYYPGDPLAWRDGTVTYLGMKMARGIVAVDPRVIPLRTRLWIPGYGYGYAADTGSAIKGNRIDLGVNNADEEKPWMHRKVVVYMLGRAKSY